MASIDVDVDDYLDEASEEALRREVERRMHRKEWKGEVPEFEKDIHAWAPSALANDIRLSYYNRNTSRFEALLVVLERHSLEAA